MNIFNIVLTLVISAGLVFEATQQLTLWSVTGFCLLRVAWGILPERFTNWETECSFLVQKRVNFPFGYYVLKLESDDHGQTVWASFSKKDCVHGPGFGCACADDPVIAVGDIIRYTTDCVGPAVAIEEYGEHEALPQC